MDIMHRLTKILTVSEIQARIPEAPHGISDKLFSAKKSARKMSDVEECDGFEQMDIDPMKSDQITTNDQATDDEERSTPHPSDDEQENSMTDDDSLQDDSTQLKRVPPVTETAPPQRDLPFARKASGHIKRTATIMANEDAEETAGDTDDDEL